MYGLNGCWGSDCTNEIMLIVFSFLNLTIDLPLSKESRLESFAKVRQMGR